MPKLNGVVIAANTDTVVYTAPTNKRATVTLNLVNTSLNNVYVKVAFVGASTSSIASSSLIEYNTLLTPGNSLERNSITPYNGESLIVRSDVAGIIASVWGYEE